VNANITALGGNNQAFQLAKNSYSASKLMLIIFWTMKSVSVVFQEQGVTINGMTSCNILLNKFKLPIRSKCDAQSVKFYH
jgi:hypothetical protein